MKKLVLNLLNSLRVKIEMDIATPTEERRFNRAMSILANEADDGRWGKAFEILNVGSTSRKVDVAKQGKVDGYFNLNGKRHAVEYKTNGGRIGSLYKLAKPEASFIVYSMDFETRTTYRKDGTARPTKHYVLAPVVMKVSDFLKVLEHTKAYKTIGHREKNDYEVAVQGDSVKLYKVLSEYPITFHPDTMYLTEDFEDIELW